MSGSQAFQSKGIASEKPCFHIHSSFTAHGSGILKNHLPTWTAEILPRGGNLLYIELYIVFLVFLVFLGLVFYFRFFWPIHYSFNLFICQLISVHYFYAGYSFYPINSAQINSSVYLCLLHRFYCIQLFMFLLTYPIIASI